MGELISKEDVMNPELYDRSSVFNSSSKEM